MQGPALEKLFFMVSVIDRVSKPVKGIRENVMRMQKVAREGFMEIGKGFSGLNIFTDPARDFSKAMGEVGSLGGAQEELDKLGVKAKSFAMDFGGNAADIVRFAYDIQSAIPGLAKGALAEFTYQGALLAKAGKSYAATITSYMGTMYNIFEKDAEKVGAGKWVEGLTCKLINGLLRSS